MYNLTEEEKWKVGALIDKNLILKISSKGKLSGTFSNKLPEPIFYLANLFKGSVCGLGGRYSLVFSGGKIAEISKAFSPYCPIMGKKLRFCEDYFLNKPKYTGDNLEEVRNRRNVKMAEFRSVQNGTISGNEPESYKLEFLDDINLFNCTKSKNKYGRDKTALHFCKVSIYKEIIKIYECLLNIKSFQERNNSVIRLGKEDSYRLALKIKETSLVPYFYELYTKGCESLNDIEIYEKIKAIKDAKIDHSLLTSKTAKQKMEEAKERKIAERAARKREKEDEKKRELELVLEKRRVRNETIQKNKSERAARLEKEKVELKAKRKTLREEKKQARAATIEQEILQGFKKCRKCKKEKSLISFNKQKDRYLPTCNQCYYENSKHKIKASIKKYQQKNKEKLREYRRNRALLPTQRIRASMKNRLKALFFRKGDTRTAEILGMPLKDFKLYIETQFRDGMSWDNYGSLWDIDHIIPCRAFDHTLKEHVMRCWNYRNLRPELKTVNYSKNDRMSNGLSARTMLMNDPEGLRKIRNEMLKEIRLEEIKDDYTPTPYPLNIPETESTPAGSVVAI
jgi:hypothetical protein